jgi:hypothetical protein
VAAGLALNPIADSIAKHVVDGLKAKLADRDLWPPVDAADAPAAVA